MKESRRRHSLELGCPRSASRTLLRGRRLSGGRVIPEPSTFALGLIGIGALMLRRSFHGKPPFANAPAMGPGTRLGWKSGRYSARWRCAWVAQ
ncbi:MAG: PEP-CTERM sorting domain-containing protein [Verrucomicrobiales bacterium]|nr:PEP-CTERM sorting domain-containing protein [Verrucomicrobiales bacterium]